ncbi:MAG: hypothetical protein JWQ45_440 [Blastococcus sp.]|jgi:hypothetical protein|nr:hypothetical protein [Blastococcus sp.]
MEVEAVGGLTSSPRVPIQPVGITAELADARAQLREAAPSEHWKGVQEEVSRLQFEQRMSPLAALHTVYAKLASGWLPHVPRS